MINLKLFGQSFASDKEDIKFYVFSSTVKNMK